MADDLISDSPEGVEPDSVPAAPALGKDLPLDEHLDLLLQQDGLGAGQRRFLLHFANTAHVTNSVRHAGVSVVTVWRWRHESEVFAKWYGELHALGVGVLEEEAKRRAFEGIVKPVYQKGVRVGSVREYSDQLAMFLLKAYDAKFKESTTVNVVGGLADAINAARNRANGG
jgi:hypothetical protein